MKKETLVRLRNSLHYAQGICDPIDYMKRQKELLYTIAECLLVELDDMEKEEEKDNFCPNCENLKFYCKCKPSVT
jgi:hypothetical protein